MGSCAAEVRGGGISGLLTAGLVVAEAARLRRRQAEVN